MSMSCIEKKFVDFCQNRVLLLASILLFIISLAVRWRFRWVESIDYTTFLRPWFEQIKAGGGFAALSESIGDYYIPYLALMAALTYLPGNPLYLLKAVTIFFDYATAATACILVLQLASSFSLKKKKLLVFFTFFSITLSPMVILNGSAWTQCDVMYTLFIIGSLVLLLKDKYAGSFILLGIAFCLKLQTVFVLPVFLLVYFTNKKFSLLYFIIIPTTYLIGGLPAVLAGRSAAEVYYIYFNQIGHYQSLTLAMPNIYSFLPELYEMFAVPGILLTAVLIIGLAAYIVYSKIELDKSLIVGLAFLFNMTCVMFLPAMHERYGFVFIILSGIYYMLHGKKIIIPILLNLVAVISYGRFLYGFLAVDMRILAAVNLGIWLYSVADMKREIDALRSNI